jgi:hypothetical protein
MHNWAFATIIVGSDLKILWFGFPYFLVCGHAWTYIFYASIYFGYYTGVDNGCHFNFQPHLDIKQVWYVLFDTTGSEWNLNVAKCFITGFWFHSERHKLTVPDSGYISWQIMQRYKRARMRSVMYYYTGW